LLEFEEIIPFKMGELPIFKSACSIDVETGKLSGLLFLTNTS